MKSSKEFCIPFIGLKLGRHEFQYEISDTFFEDIEYSIIRQGHVYVGLVLDKKETMLIGDFALKGTVSTYCDRCNELMDFPVKGNYKIIYKFGTEASDDETLIVLDPDAYEIQLKETIYELLTVTLPAKMTHEAGKCNPEMLELLEKYIVTPSNSEDEDDQDDWSDDEDDEDDEPLDLSRFKINF
jgi:uncharacterized metal-binding protein YceD (DUF177 family)